jgi:hypothetical protein
VAIRTFGDAVMLVKLLYLDAEKVVADKVDYIFFHDWVHLGLFDV